MIYLAVEIIYFIHITAYLMMTFCIDISVDYLSQHNGDKWWALLPAIALLDAIVSWSENKEHTSLLILTLSRRLFLEQGMARLLWRRDLTHHKHIQLKQTRFFNALQVYDKDHLIIWSFNWKYFSRLPVLNTDISHTRTPAASRKLQKLSAGPRYSCRDCWASLQIQEGSLNACKHSIMSIFCKFQILQT